MKYLVVEGTMIDEDRCWLRLIGFGDPVIPRVFTWLINFCIRKGAALLALSTIAKAKIMKDSVWDKRRKEATSENKDFYDWARVAF